MEMCLRELIEKPVSGLETVVRKGKLSAISGVDENVDFRWLCSMYVLRTPVKTAKPCKLVI